MEDALRQALKQAHAHCESIHEREAQTLDTSEAWQKLKREQREPIAHRNRLNPIPALEISTADRLAAALQTRSLSGWAELRNQLMPVSSRRALNELPDELWTKINIEFYADPAVPPENLRDGARGGNVPMPQLQQMRTQLAPAPYLMLLTQIQHQLLDRRRRALGLTSRPSGSIPQPLIRSFPVSSDPLVPGLGTDPKPPAEPSDVGTRR